MDNWTKLKRLYVNDHKSKDYLKSPQTRLNAVERIEEIFSMYFPHILKQPKFLNQMQKDDFKKEVALKKGADLNGAEHSVINGLYQFIGDLK
jgi:hypothetical protein